MPLKTIKTVPQSLRDKYKRNKSCSEKTTVVKMPKKVLISKKWHPNCSHEVKTKSAGIIGSKQREKPEKTWSSLPAVPKYSEIKDFCNRCGDTDDIETAVAFFPSTVEFRTHSKANATSSKNDKKDLKTHIQQVTAETKVVKQYYKNEKFADSKSTTDYTKKPSNNHSAKTSKEIKRNKKEVANEVQVVQEHYLNEKFADLYDSIHDFDNIIRSGPILDTITEVNEKQTASEGKRASSDDKSTSEYNIFEQSDDDSSLRRLKEFREKNYFECHSVKKRIESNGSTFSLKDHKCRYRLYLNDRLFPVAIDNDHNGNIRCVDCHLSSELAKEDDKVNGTIQAKVKLGSETQDMVLLLPIKEPMIIKQKRKEKVDDEVVYFGLVRLDQNGNSMFNPTLPSDSLALRYQKGYRQYNNMQNYRYDKIEESDVVFV